MGTVYPTQVADESCVISGGYIYCVGGLSSHVYYAPILPDGGIGTWMNTTSYPTDIQYESCAAFQSGIYCVGGITGEHSDNPISTNATYYAPLSSSGVGIWTATTSLPASTYQAACTMSPGTSYLYLRGRCLDQRLHSGFRLLRVHVFIWRRQLDDHNRLSSRRDLFSFASQQLRDVRRLHLLHGRQRSRVLRSCLVTLPYVDSHRDQRGHQRQFPHRVHCRAEPERQLHCSCLYTRYVQSYRRTIVHGHRRRFWYLSV